MHVRAFPKTPNELILMGAVALMLNNDLIGPMLGQNGQFVIKAQRVNSIYSSNTGS